MKEFYQELIAEIKRKKPSKREISKLKHKFCAKYKIKRVPTDIDILLHSDTPKQIEKYLQTKPGRSVSGVIPIAIMAKPIACPHGKCIMCPGGPKSKFKAPQSYTGKEPATMRGIRNAFDSYLQVFNRLEQYIVTGHSIDKTELIIMGGTFPSFPKRYQDDFIKYAFKAMNDFSRMFYTKGKLNIKKFKQFFELPGVVGDPKRTKSIQTKLKKLKGKTTLEKEQHINEKTKVRCVALCIETRPDYAKQKHINQMLRLGTTRVELGVQSLDDGILKKINRGHTVKDTIEATKLLKDAYLKVGYHMMPGLPGSCERYDILTFRELFGNSDFRPDALKIYPCMVIPGTKLYNMHKKGRFKPLTTEQAAYIIAHGKRYVPRYCRIMRVQRDIPTHVISAGVDKTNLRQYVERFKTKCECIRCREIGRHNPSKLNITLNYSGYHSNGAEDIFISADETSTDSLLGFCRLRINKETAGIRELHVYGQALELGKKGSTQHKGWGKRLLKAAERLAKQNGCKTMYVISGIGVREYYRRLGYRRKGPYMVKSL